MSRGRAQDIRAIPSRSSVDTPGATASPHLGQCSWATTSPASHEGELGDGLQLEGIIAPLHRPSELTGADPTAYEGAPRT